MKFFRPIFMVCWLLSAYVLGAEPSSAIHDDVLTINDWSDARLKNLVNDQLFLTTELLLIKELNTILKQTITKITSMRKPKELLAFYLTFHTLYLQSRYNLDLNLKFSYTNAIPTHTYANFFRTPYKILQNQRSKAEQNTRNKIIDKCSQIIFDNDDSIGKRILLKNRMNMLYSLAYAIKKTSATFLVFYNTYLDIFNYNQIKASISDVRDLLNINGTSNAEIAEDNLIIFTEEIMNQIMPPISRASL